MLLWALLLVGGVKLRSSIALAFVAYQLLLLNVPGNIGDSSVQRISVQLDGSLCRLINQERIWKSLQKMGAIEGIRGQNDQVFWTIAEMP